MKSYMLIGSLAGVFIAGMSSNAAAENQIPGLMPELLNCKNMADDSNRLACFDQIVTGIDSVTVAAVVDAEPEPVLTAEESFGSEDLASTQKKLRKEREKVKSITSSVIEIARNGNRKYVIILENGQIWRQLMADTNSLRVPSSSTQEMTAEIKRRKLGGHSLYLNGERRSIKVERIK